MFGHVIDHEIFDFHDTIQLFKNDIHIECVKFGGCWFIVKELQSLLSITNTEVRIMRRRFPEHFKIHTTVGLICTDYIARHMATRAGVVRLFIESMRTGMIYLRGEYTDPEQET